MNKKNIDKIKSTLLSFVEDNNVPLLNIAISNKEKDIFTYHAGMLSYDNGELKPKLFLASSIVKTITSFGIMKLVNENKLSLEDRIIDIFPRLKESSNINNRIRIIDLLSHKSGMNRIPYNWIQKTNQNLSITEIIDKGLYDFSINSKLYGKFEYSNAGYDLLGGVIEKISKTSYSNFIKKNIFEPLGFTNSFFSDIDLDNKDLAKPHIVANNEIYKIDAIPSTKYHESSCIFYTNVLDMTKLGRLHLNFGTINNKVIIDNKMYDDLWKSQIKTEHPDYTDYGLGWYISSINNHTVYGHGGREYGYNSIFIVSPNCGITLSLMLNVHKAKTIQLAITLCKHLLG